MVLGVVLGAVGGVAGAFAGHSARVGLSKALNGAGGIVAVCEDVVAIGGGLLIASRF
jgi:uncharacterized membrane protein